MSIFVKIFSYLGIGIVIFLLARTGILLVHYQNFSSLSLSDIILAFFYGIRFDLASLLVFSGIPLLLMALPFHWCTSQWWHVTLSGIVFFVFVLAIAKQFSFSPIPVPAARNFGRTEEKQDGI